MRCNNSPLSRHCSEHCLLYNAIKSSTWWSPSVRSSRWVVFARRFPWATWWTYPAQLGWASGRAILAAPTPPLEWEAAYPPDFEGGAWRATPCVWVVEYHSASGPSDWSPPIALRACPKHLPICVTGRPRWSHTASPSGARIGASGGTYHQGAWRNASDVDLRSCGACCLGGSWRSTICYSGSRCASMRHHAIEWRSWSHAHNLLICLSVLTSTAINFSWLQVLVFQHAHFKALRYWVIPNALNVNSYSNENRLSWKVVSVFFFMVWGLRILKSLLTRLNCGKKPLLVFCFIFFLLYNESITVIRTWFEWIGPATIRNIP